MDRRALAGLIVASALAAAVGIAVARRGRDEGARCGPGFVAEGSRCLLPASARGPDGACPAPLVRTPRGCDAPDVRVLIPAAALAMGPSDWEAEGRVAPRTLRVQAFRIDAFEVTRGRLGQDGEPARAASGMTRAEAAAFCASAGGRLPTEDEWIVAAASAANPPRRYPWGDTGAVCRRAAWGLSAGPCARGSDGPDTVGAHPDGDSPLGLHDLAGNVAEWVTEPPPGAGPPPPAATATTPPASTATTPPAANGVSGQGPRNNNGIAKGGSWASDLASDLRIWARLELPSDAAGRAVRDPRVGFRCAYPP